MLKKVTLYNYSFIKISSFEYKKRLFIAEIITDRPHHTGQTEVSFLDAKAPVMEGTVATAAAGRKRALPASVLAMHPSKVSREERAATPFSVPTATSDDATALLAEKENNSRATPASYVSTYNGDPVLPHRLPQGVKIFVAETVEQTAHFCGEIAARRAKAAAAGSRVAIGFDIEWTVTFERGKTQRRASLLQLCFLDAIILFRLLSICPLPALLFELLCDETLYKVGVNVAGDAAKIERDYSSYFLPLTGSAGAGRARIRGLIDIRHLLRAFRVSRVPASQSLKELAAFYLNCAVQKEASVQQSNWEAPKLSPRQVAYAAADAHLSLQLYHRVLKVAIEERFPHISAVAAAGNTSVADSGKVCGSSSSGGGGDGEWRAYVCEVLRSVAEDQVTETPFTLELHRSINGHSESYAEYAKARRKDAEAAHAAEREEKGE